MGAGGNRIVMDAGFWSMGGYARFVWPCFGLTLAVLAWNVWAARRLLAKARLRAERAIASAAMDRS
jgi:heme exporter protein CcmD